MSGNKPSGLSGFLKNQLDQTPELPEQQTPELPEQQTTKLAKSDTLEVTKSVSLQESPRHNPKAVQPKTKAAKVTANLETEPIHFEDFERKECRLRAEQFTALSGLERRLSRAKRGRDGPRITANTLIRVAVDLLLEHGDRLTAVNEAALLTELRRSVRAIARG